MLRKFARDYAAPERIDRAKRIKQVSVEVFKVRVEEFRGVAWYDQDGGVIWLTRALSDAKYHEHDDLYREVGMFETRGSLLPTADEIASARREQYRDSVVSALADATERAENTPDDWVAAEIVRPSGEVQEVGRAYFERETNGGEFDVRYLLIRRTLAATGTQLPQEWLARIVSTCFPPGEKPGWILERDLPAGTNRDPDEIPMCQCVIVDE